MRLLKMLFTLTGFVLILIAFGVLLLSSQGDRVAEEGMERALALVFPTEVQLGEISVSFPHQRIDVQDLVVSNPPSFKEGAAIKVDHVAITIDATTLFSDVPTIKEVLLDGYSVNLRYELGEGTNLGCIARQLSQGGELESFEPEPTYLIREFRCEGGSVSMSTNLVPVPKVGMKLANFGLENLGNRPITSAKITSIFLRSVLKETLTLKGLLRPVAKLIARELDELAGE